MKCRLGSFRWDAVRASTSKGIPHVIRFLASPPRPALSWVLFTVGTIILSVALGACKSNTGPTTDRPLEPPTNPQAYSGDDSTVVLYWSASKSRDLSVFDKYRVTVADDTGAVVATQFTPTGSVTTMTMTGLRAGETFTFGIVATVVPSASGYTESAPAVIEWAPAPRFVADTIGLLRLYDATLAYPDSGGLIAFDTTIGGPRRTSLLTPGRDSLLLDIVVISGGTPMYIGSAEYYSPGWRQTRFSSVIDFAASLDFAQPVPPDSLTYTLSYIEVPNSFVSLSAIVYFRTADGNFGRLLIERDPSKGTLIWGPYPYRYLTVQVSYQTTPDIPYSERAQLEERKH